MRISNRRVVGVRFGRYVFDVLFSFYALVLIPERLPNAATPMHAKQPTIEKGKAIGIS